MKDGQGSKSVHCRCPELCVKIVNNGSVSLIIMCDRKGWEQDRKQANLDWILILQVNFGQVMEHLSLIRWATHRMNWDNIKNMLYKAWHMVAVSYMLISYVCVCSVLVRFHPWAANQAQCKQEPLLQRSASQLLGLWVVIFVTSAFTTVHSDSTPAKVSLSHSSK